ncbi:ATP-binding protein [Oribacterium asaccharolyticum]|uniref:ATP-binding protein n=1 Tax=Oribacterium asaccharolyticum TaxID=1501332 RepID=UPI0028E39ED4|nr:AAA family ATPase [Oribacterium asaccharolyticum]
MIITSLEISGFGKFHQFSLDFSPLCNVIYGENEAGKSTLHAFIQGMLYGIPSSPSRKEQFFRHRPFQKELPFGGKLFFSYQNKSYCLSRDFLSGGNAVILPLDTNTPVSDADCFLEEVLSSFSSESFHNTVFIRQLKTGTDREMVKELQKIFSNMEHSGNMHINPEAAIAYLSEEEKRIQEQIYFQAEKEYSALLGDVKNSQRELSAKEREETPGLISDSASEVKASTSFQEEKNYKNLLENKISVILHLQKEIQTLEEFVHKEGFHSEEEVLNEESTVKQLLSESEALDGQKKQAFLFPFCLLFLSVLFLCYSLLSYLYFYTDYPIPGFFAFQIHSVPMLYPAFCLGLFFGIFSFTSFVERKKRIQLEQKQNLFFREIANKRNFAAYAAFSNSSKEEVDKSAPSSLFSPYVLDKYYSEVKNNFTLLSEKRAKIEELNTDISALKEEEQKEEERKKRLEEEENVLEEKLRQIGSWQNRAEQIRPSLYDNEKLREKLEAIAEAKERIHALSEEIYQSFAFYLNKETAKILSYITGERYDSLFIDQNLRIFVNTKETMLPLEQASTGTIDQLYLSLRLAMAKLLQKERKEYLPLLFDDSFAMYDENRLAAALSFVNKAYPAQILLFTCHKREAEVLQQLDIPFHMSSL